MPEFAVSWAIRSTGARVVFFDEAPDQAAAVAMLEAQLKLNAGDVLWVKLRPISAEKEISG